MSVRVLVAAVCAVGMLAFGSVAAGAATTGAAGPIDVSVSPTSRLADGQAVTITATAPRGVLIYEIRAHLCIAGKDVTNGYDFGFQGKRCTNVAVGHSDVEQSAPFPNGVATGTLDAFKVGTGTKRWVNELGFPETITCGPEHPCALVVRVEITDAAMFFTAPLCFGATCPAGSTKSSSSGSSGFGVIVAAVVVLGGALIVFAVVSRRRRARVGAR